MKDLLKFGSITFFVVAVLSLAIIEGALGQSANEDVKQTIDMYNAQLVGECAIIFDNDNVNSKTSNFCDQIMNVFDEECRENYHAFCFGDAWVNYPNEHKERLKERTN